MFEIQAVMSRFSLYSYGVYFTFVLYYAMKSGILVVGAIAIAISTQEWFSHETGYIYFIMTFCFLLWPIYGFDSRGLSHIPGPFLASLSKLVMVYHLLRGRLSTWYAEVSDSYSSPLARIGPNHLITKDPELFRRMAAPKSRYERSDWYTGVNFRPGSPENVTSERVESKHRELREKTCPGYSGKDIPRLEERIHDTVNAELSVLTNTLNDSAPVPNGAGEVIIDWSTCMTRLSLNVLCQLGFAGKLSDDEIDFIINKIKAGGTAFAFMTIFPSLHGLLASICSHFPLILERFGLCTISGMADRKVRECYSDPSNRTETIVTSFKEHGLTPDQASAHLVVQIIAGFAVTGTALTSVFIYLLSAPPDILNCLSNEVDDRCKTLQDNHLITYKDCRRLGYLDACIKEAMRMMPPAPFLMEKIVPPGGDVYEGIRIPGGTRIGHSTRALMRNETIFGKNTHEYHPERWLDAINGDEMRRTLDLNFSYGRFSCLGKPVALMEISIVVFEVVRRFKLIPLAPPRLLDNGIPVVDEFLVSVTQRRPATSQNA